MFKVGNEQHPRRKYFSQEKRILAVSLKQQKKLEHLGTLYEVIKGMNVFESEHFRPWLCSAFVNVESNTRYAAGYTTPALREGLPDVHSTKANPHCRPNEERGDVIAIWRPAAGK